MAICQRCEHEWTVRVKAHPPRRCPNCTSPAWDRNLKRPGRPKGFRWTRPIKPPAPPRVPPPLVFDGPAITPSPLCTLDQAREILRRINA